MDKFKYSLFAKFMGNTSKPQKLVVYKHSKNWVAKDYKHIGTYKRPYLTIKKNTRGTTSTMFKTLIDMGYKMTGYGMDRYTIFELRMNNVSIPFKRKEKTTLTQQSFLSE